MTARAQSCVVEFHAWDTSSNIPKTGDAANITLRWVKDGTSAALNTATVNEIDSTNAPGVYKCTLSATETDCLVGKLCGKSATANIYIFGPTIAFDQLPIAVPGAAGGVFIAGSNAGTSVNFTGNLSGSVGSVTAAVSVNSNIKQNVALAGFEFLMTDSTNHNPATGKTVTVTRSIDGGAFGAGTLSAVTEISNGMYKCDFGAGDLSGKVITLRAVASLCDDLFVTIITEP